MIHLPGTPQKLAAIRSRVMTLQLIATQSPTRETKKRKRLVTKRKENKKVRVREPTRTTRTVMEKTRKTTVRITKMMVRKKTTKEEMAAAGVVIKVEVEMIKRRKQIDDEQNKVRLSFSDQKGS